MKNFLISIALFSSSLVFSNEWKLSNGECKTLPNNQNEIIIEVELDKNAKGEEFAVMKLLFKVWDGTYLTRTINGDIQEEENYTQIMNGSGSISLIINHETPEVAELEVVERYQTRTIDFGCNWSL